MNLHIQRQVLRPLMENQPRQTQNLSENEGMEVIDARIGESVPEVSFNFTKEAEPQSKIFAVYTMWDFITSNRRELAKFTGDFSELRKPCVEDMYLGSQF
jgi:hypothetical protein